MARCAAWHTTAVLRPVRASPDERGFRRARKAATRRRRFRRAALSMRNHLTPRYFDTAHAIVQATVTEDLPPFVAAARRLLDHLTVHPRL
ncbi:MAG: hypothetical protein LC749_14770 [Actinobacteria bacterium]|nr:hypothetical protein [Actinomycetota bacterium]